MLDPCHPCGIPGLSFRLLALNCPVPAAGDILGINQYVGDLYLTLTAF